MLLPARFAVHAVLGFVGLLGDTHLLGEDAFNSEAERFIPNIRLTEKNWGQGAPEDVEKILQSTARQLFPFTGKKDWADILVGKSPHGPVVLFRRGENGEYIINLNTRDRFWCQYAFQFAHEIGHIICGFRKGDKSNLWFEETICEVASLFALEKLALEWNHSAPYANWQPYAEEFKKYADQRISKHLLPQSYSLEQLYKKRASALKAKADDRETNTRMATALLPIFRESPQGWAACTFLNLKKTRQPQSFETYLNDWRDNCSSNEQRKFVRKVSQSFGVILPLLTDSQAKPRPRVK